MTDNITELNLESGMPIVAQAMDILTKEIFRKHNMGFEVLKIIHGFGSTGTGGKIRVATRKKLAEMRDKGQIIDFVIGENFSIFDSTSRKLLDLAPELRAERDLDRHNNGVTFVIL